MQAVTTIGLDIAKSVFQVYGVDAAGNVLVRRKLKRRYVLAFFEKLHRPWLSALLARRPTKVAAIALARALRVKCQLPVEVEKVGDRGEPVPHPLKEKCVLLSRWPAPNYRD